MKSKLAIKKLRNIVIVIILLTIFGAGGYAMLKLLNPYLGWKSYTLKYEKLTVRYPKNWTTLTTAGIKDGPPSPPYEDVYFRTTGSDLQLGLTVTCAAEVTYLRAPVIHVDSVKVLGQQGYIYFESIGNDTGDKPLPLEKINDVHLSMSADNALDYLHTRNTVSSQKTPCPIWMDISFYSSNYNNHFTWPSVDQIEKDKAYPTMKKIIESFKY